MALATKPELEELARLLKPGQVITNPVELLTYEVDAANDRGKPDGVAFPITPEDVEMIVRWAARHRIPLVARGAGTGLSGGAVAERGGLIVAFSRMNRILELQPAGRCVSVEPGVVHADLDACVRRAGLFYPPDPASGRSATLGGNIAENAGGPHCFKYGVTTNYLTGLDVVLASGQRVRLGGKALDYPEYDLLGLVTGSEGTLGVVTRADIRLKRVPPGVKTMMAAFSTVEEAGEAVSAIIAQGLVPATLEFMDRKMMGMIEDYAHAGLPLEAGAALIIEVDGFPESLAPQIEEIISILKSHNAFDLRVAQTGEERDRIWYGRKSAAGAMARLAPAYYLLDGTVPRSKLAHTLGLINHACEKLDLRVGYVFHAGDGNLHPFILIDDPHDPEMVGRVHEAGRMVMEICVAQRGSITGEHGVGIEKRSFMPLMYGPDELQAMWEVKEAFDPQGILNPGKILPPREEIAAVTRPSESSPLRELRERDGNGDDLFEPRSVPEAAEALRYAAADGKHVRLRGGGSKSGLLPEVHPILSTRNLAGIHEYALQDLYITAGAGTRLADLQAELALDGMWLPLVSPWEEATLGGIIAANANAPLRMRYGGIRDLVLASTVVQIGGRVLQLGRPVVKNVAGYDLTRLSVGSYGTLGLIAEVTLKLAPLPRRRSSLIVPLEDLNSGLALAARLLPLCLNASALLLCSGCPELTPAPFHLIYTAEGLAEDVGAEMDEVRRAAQAALQPGGASGLQEVSVPSGTEVWQNWMRLAMPHPARGAARAPVVRAGVPVHQLPGLVQSLASELVRGSFVADIANGLLYTQGGPETWTLRRAALQLGGYAVLLASPPGEPLLPDDIWGYEPAGLELMDRLKERWDPDGLLNPGAFL